jgi:prepilin-type N-terminal cleavage/methylation domain-containing protein
MTRRWRAQIDDELGFTLVELLVVMSLMLIIGSVAVNGIVSGLRASERGRQRVVALTDLERAAERMARDLRFADPVESGSATSVTVNVLRDAGGTQVRHRVVYTVSAGTISETRAVYNPPSAASATSTTTSTVIDNLSTGTTVFTYAKADGQTWVSGTDAVTDLAEIEVRLRRELSGQNPIEVQTSVFVRNVDDGR